MKYSSRVFLWAPFALLMVLALAASARWWSVADDLSRRLDSANGHEISPGVRLHFAAKSISGFPFNVDAVFRDFELRVDGPHGPILWRAQNFAGHALTYGRNQWIFEAAGRQRLEWTTLSGDTKGLDFESGSLHASAILSEASLTRFDLDVIGFNSPAFASGRTQLHMRHRSDAIDVVMSADELRLSPQLRGLCGERIDRIAVGGDFSDASTFAGVLRAVSRWQDGIDRWRKAGGRFFLSDGSFVCGKTEAALQGQVALDEMKRPRGLVTAQIQRFSALRDAAARQGVEGTLANALINQPPEPNPEQEGRVTVRAAFRDGITYLGNTPAGTNDPLYR